MKKSNLALILFILVASLSADCDGFNWYHNIDINDCDPGDVMVLRQFIINSENLLEYIHKSHIEM